MAPVRTTEEYAQMGWREFHALLEPYERIGIHKCTSDEDVRYYLELIFQVGSRLSGQQECLSCIAGSTAGWEEEARQEHEYDMCNTSWARMDVPERWRLVVSILHEVHGTSC